MNGGKIAPFVRLPHDLQKDTQRITDAGALAVYLAIRRFAAARGGGVTASPSLESIASVARCGRTAIKERINILIAAGYLSKIRRVDEWTREPITNQYIFSAEHEAGTFSEIPRAFLDDEQITTVYEISTYAAMRYFMRLDVAGVMCCHASNLELMTLARCSRTSLRRALEQLESCDYFRCTYAGGGRGRSCKYELVPLARKTGGADRGPDDEKISLRAADDRRSMTGGKSEESARAACFEAVEQLRNGGEHEAGAAFRLFMNGWNGDKARGPCVEAWEYFKSEYARLSVARRAEWRLYLADRLDELLYSRRRPEFSPAEFLRRYHFQENYYR